MDHQFYTSKVYKNIEFLFQTLLHTYNILCIYIYISEDGNATNKIKNQLK